MSERFLFADLLSAHTQRRDLSLAQVARRADLPRRTLANWVEGRVQRPRQWQQVMAVATALQLDADQMLALLAAAGHAFTWQELRARVEATGDKTLIEIVQQSSREGEAGRNPQPLPADLTPFVGRAHERCQVAEIVAEQHCRLLTLLGLGGSGKTRLALQLARELQPGYEHGAAFLLLPPPTQADVDLETNLVSAILSGLANPSDKISLQLPLARKLNDILAQRQLLLILDNFDPYLEAAHVLPRLLQFAPRLQLLVTCRQSLAVEGEWCYEVPGLSLPDDTTPVEASDAANLFVSSGRRLRSDFTLATENAAAIIEICRVLGGHPLAIELAAGWLRVASPQEIAARLRQDVMRLSSNRQDIPERQRTIRAVVDWALLRLPEQQLQLMRKLSIFTADIDLRAATAITGATYADLTTLTDLSLIQRRGDRYTLHPLVRQHAAEQLQAHDKEHESTQALLVDYYTGYISAHASELQGSEALAASRAIERELDHILLAWQLALSRQRFTALAQAQKGLFRYFRLVGPWSEGERVFRQAAAYLCLRDSETAADPELCAQLLLNQAFFLQKMGQYKQALVANSKAYTLSIIAENPNLQAQAYQQEGVSLWGLSDFDAALTTLRRAVDLAERVQAWPVLAQSLRALGGIHIEQGDSSAADQVLRPAMRLSQAEGNKVLESQVLHDLGIVSHLQGGYSDAERFYVEAIAAKEQIGNRTTVAPMYNNLGIIYAAHGDFRGAARAFDRSLAIKRRIGNELGVGTTYVNLGLIAHSLGEYDRAERYYDNCLTIQRQFSNVAVEAEALAYLGLLDYHRHSYDQAEAYCRQALSLIEQHALHTTHAFSLLFLGHALAAQTRYAEAKVTYQQALLMSERKHQLHYRPEGLAGLAAIAWAQGDASTARSLVLSIITHIEQNLPNCPNRHGLDGAYEPFWVYLICSKVLSAQEHGQATWLIEIAYNALLHSARQLNGRERSVYLNGIYAHQEILALGKGKDNGIVGLR